MKKLFIFFYSAFLIFNSAFSFGQEIEWQAKIGGSVEEELRALHQTSDGGYICAGSSRSGISGDKTENSRGDYDYWVVKLDAAHSIVWQKTIGGDSADLVRSIDETSDGGYIIGGYSKSTMSGDKTENCIGLNDYWIVKIDASGNIQWQNTIGGNNDDKLMSLQQTTDDGYILCGFSSSDISGDKTENSMGDSDYWIVKTDATGNIQWQKTYGGSASDGCSYIQQTSDGGYIIAGDSYSGISGDKTEINYGASDYWIIKIDATGNIQWQNSIGGNATDALFTSERTSDNGYILGGYSTSSISGDKTENCLGGMDYWIVKIDSTGNIQWQNTIGGNDWDRFDCIIQTSDGGYICGGNSFSPVSYDKTENGNGNVIFDLWIVKLDSAGNIQWQNTIGGNGDEIFQDIHQTSDGKFIIAGMAGPYITGDITVPGNGLYDFWILKITDKFNIISGKAFVDYTSNAIQDIGEPGTAINKITETNTSRIAFTDQNGNYNLHVLDTGSYIVSATNNLNNFIAAPAIQVATFNSIFQIDSLNDFAFQPASAFNDLCVSLTSLSPLRPGFNASYKINYQNVGTTILNGSIKLFTDTLLSYLASSPNATTVNTDSIEWNIGTLTPFQSGTIFVNFNVSSAAVLGSACHTIVLIEPIAGDTNPTCNVDTSSVLITASMDPNDILVSEDTLFTYQLIDPDYLDYIIRFQNTGNDTAFTVNVLNPIDTNKLELRSIEFVKSSHPVNLTWKPWERNMHFTFNNILLPDSNINEPLSHGFVHYRIKPKTTLLAGDSISNNAYIYFDFNAPVATNTAITKIVLPTGISDVSFENYDLKVFPNPAKDEITIAGYALQNNQPAVLKIYDVMGKEVFSQSIVNSTSQIVNLKSFTSGVYFVQLQTGAKVSRAKFVKQ